MSLLARIKLLDQASARVGGWRVLVSSRVYTKTRRFCLSVSSYEKGTKLSPGVGTARLALSSR